MLTTSSASTATRRSLDHPVNSRTSEVPPRTGSWLNSQSPFSLTWQALNCGGPASQAEWVPVVVDSALLPTRLGDAVHGGPQPVSRLAGGRARRGLGLDA